MKRNILLILTNLSLVFVGWSQTGTQTIKGIITDKDSKYPLIGVTVAVIDVDPIMGATTDENGAFKITDVPQGRRTLKISYIGYKEQILPNVVLTSGKETVVDFQLAENVVQTDEVVIKADADKTQTNNDMIVVSARSFNLEEATRYAGSLNDPSRMAANFAGVSGANDGRNDIVIRGNSPLGLLWRLEGIEIPNPNHFGSQGSSGGPVSILNTNQLGKSDFMTSAFPANYGNATSGVFDLTMRRPNNEKRETMFQIGFNGLEAGTEGRFSKNSKASYMVNYRYSTLAVFNLLGMGVGTGNAIPQYQDVNFKVELPTNKFGKFSVFGLGGLSWIDLLDSKTDIALNSDLTRKKGSTSFYTDGYTDIRFSSNTGVVGASHIYFIDPTLSIKTVVAQSGSEQVTTVQRFYRKTEVKDGNYFSVVDNNTFRPNYDGMLGVYRSSVNISVNKKFNVRNTLNSGVNVDRIGFKMIDKGNISRVDSIVTITQFRDNVGANYLVQAWSNLQHKFNEKFTANIGLHYQILTLNNKMAIEPRLGLRYQVAPKTAINFGAGVHNQTQPVYFYYNQTPGNSELTNKNLGFTNSNHVVVGVDQNVGSNWRIKAETYYQYLTNVPVESHPSSFSMLNLGANFDIPNTDSLVNKGTGYNYGAELTIERFFNNGFYFLNTISLFESKYKGSDGIERNTAFNGNYVVNLLGGYEFKIGKKNTASINLRGTVAGGKRVTPIDLNLSRQRQNTAYDDTKAFSEQLPTYFRTDLTVSFRRDGKRISQEWRVLVNNITDNKNVFLRRYDVYNDAIADTYQLPLQVVPQYRILF
ncbi:MAG: TonB-dependent receptor [Bacteroidota bacterium]|nr:TonB-dependent receptor [Bacteroidota bacterium]